MRHLIRCSGTLVLPGRRWLPQGLQGRGCRTWLRRLLSRLLFWLLLDPRCCNNFDGHFRGLNLVGLGGLGTRAFDGRRWLPRGLQGRGCRTWRLQLLSQFWLVLDLRWCSFDGLLLQGGCRCSLLLILQSRGWPCRGWVGWLRLLPSSGLLCCWRGGGGGAAGCRWLLQGGCWCSLLRIPQDRDLP